MKVLAALALAAAALTSPMTTGAAHASPNPTGTLCGFAAVTDPQVAGSRTGVIVGGPLAFPDDTNVSLAYTGTLVCTIQVGTNDTHGEPDAILPMSGNKARVSAVAGTTWFESSKYDDHWMCSHVEFSWPQPPLYWDASARDWSPSSSVPCALATSAESPIGPLARELDPILCPLLALVFPPEGDIVLIGEQWDCPPYDWYGGGGLTSASTELVFRLPQATEPR